MNVLYEGEIFRTQLAGGINRYFSQIINRLPASVVPSLIVESRGGANFPQRSNLRVHSYGPWPALEGLSWTLHQWYLKARRQRCDRLFESNRFDVVHPSYYWLFSGRPFAHVRPPVVQTIHDMIHELYPAICDQRGEVAAAKKAAIQSASAIICDSENTKRDLQDRHALPDERIVVIPLAAGLDASMATGQEAVPNRPYFLYVGSRAEYKNFRGLLTAFAQVASTESEVVLCVVGARFTPDEQKQIEHLRLKERIAHIGVTTDAHLARLYTRSVALVYPSLYEGFGIPPLEAMCCDTAVIAARSSSIPEVVGDAGLLVDPSDLEELGDAMLRVGRDSELRSGLIEKGRQRAKLFSWDRTARETFAVYESVAG